VETYAGNSGLLYHGDGNWQFNWKTPSNYKGTCKTLRLNLLDEGGASTRTADFKFR
jgi:hypothetical protein